MWNIQYTARFRDSPSIALEQKETFSKVLTLTITPSESFASLGVAQDQEKGASAPREFSVGDQRMGGEVGGVLVG